MGDWTNPRPPRADQVDLARIVDLSHPAARGLRAMVPLWLARAPYDARDAVRGRVPTAVAGGLIRGDDQFGRAYAFNGVSWRVDYPSVGSLNGNPHTFVIWAKFRALANQYVFTVHPSGDSAVGLWVNWASSGSRLQFGVSGSALLTRQTTDAIATDQWQQWVFTWSGYQWWETSVRIFLNGKECSYYTGTNGSSLVTCDGSLSLGGRKFDNSRNWNGDLALFAYYDRILGDEEIFNLWHPGRRWGMLRTLTGRRVFSLPAGPTVYPFFFNRYVLRRRYA